MSLLSDVSDACFVLVLLLRNRKDFAIRIIDSAVKDKLTKRK